MLKTVFSVIHYNFNFSISNSSQLLIFVKFSGLLKVQLKVEGTSLRTSIVI